MAQQRRMIYSSIYANAELNMRPVEERMLYIGTLVLADDDGKLRADPRYLKGQIFPYDEKITVSDVEKWLVSLASFNQILLYERDGIKVLKHPNWAKYQRIRADLYVPSKLPSPLRVRNADVTPESLNISNINKDNITSEEGSSRSENIVRVIEAFTKVDPKNKTYYGNTTQRNAADFLIEEYGIDEVLKRIAVLVKTNKVPHFPSITCPLQLKDKWVQLQDAVERKRNEIKSKSPVAFT